LILQNEQSDEERIEAVPSLKVLARDWKVDLASLFASTTRRLIISSPFVTGEGTVHLLSHLPSDKSRINVRLLTDLSPINICLGSTDVDSLLDLAHTIPNFTLLHLPKLHAKVYVADSHNAIVTSANLTGGGLDRNYEYGLFTNSPGLVCKIADDITEYSNLGGLVTNEYLLAYSRVVKTLKSTYKMQQRSIKSALKKEFERCVLSAEDELIRLRLAGGAMHTVFAKTILYLLRRNGAMKTVDLHPQIQQLHLDLCDDNVDRIIDGKQFGKKWKHAVRTAQQQLKKQGLIRFANGRWEVSSS
jgi:hypothetical protein